jgi:hypothetical protein
VSFPITYVIIPLISALIGGYVSFYFSSKAKKYEAVLKFKEEKYANLLVHLQGFVGSTTSYETKKQFFEEQYKSWIYGSDEVIKATNYMIQLVIDAQGSEPDHEEGKRAVGNIVLAMRKDLLGKTKLTHKDFRYTDVHKNKSIKS